MESKAKIIVLYIFNIFLRSKDIKICNTNINTGMKTKYAAKHQSNFKPCVITAKKSENFTPLIGLKSINNGFCTTKQKIQKT